ncbi:MAG: MerR family transcriptional regulator [Phycisphaerales bacterium]|nr:MerR family transcriptional regulator [Phycisphaerales bacterium]
MTPNPDLEAHRTRVFPIEELAKLVEAMAGERFAGSANAATPTSVGGRARPLSPRGVRWYQSLGLIDAPRRVENRRSLYEFRHLLQLLAIRLAQARGASIEELQRAAIAQIPTDELELALDELMGEQNTKSPLPSPTSAAESSSFGQRSSGTTEKPEVSQLTIARGLLGWGAATSVLQPVKGELRAESVGSGAILLLDPARVDDADRLFAAVRRIVRQRARALAADTEAIDVSERSSRSLLGRLGIGSRDLDQTMESATDDTEDASREDRRKAISREAVHRSPRSPKAPNGRLPNGKAPNGKSPKPAPRSDESRRKRSKTDP